jgi:hypothetical protein
MEASSWERKSSIGTMQKVVSAVFAILGLLNKTINGLHDEPLTEETQRQLMSLTSKVATTTSYNNKNVSATGFNQLQTEERLCKWLEHATSILAGILADMDECEEELIQYQRNLQYKLRKEHVMRLAKYRKDKAFRHEERKLESQRRDELGREDERAKEAVVKAEAERKEAVAVAERKAAAAAAAAAAERQRHLLIWMERAELAEVNENLCVRRVEEDAQRNRIARLLAEEKK